MTDAQVSTAGKGELATGPAAEPDVANARRLDRMARDLAVLQAQIEMFKADLAWPRVEEPEDVSPAELTARREDWYRAKLQLIDALVRRRRAQS